MSRISKTVILLAVVFVSSSYHFRDSIIDYWNEIRSYEKPYTVILSRGEQYLYSWTEALRDEKFYLELLVRGDMYMNSWGGTSHAENISPELSIHGEQYLKMLLDKQYEQLSTILEPHLMPSSEGHDIEMSHALSSLVRNEPGLHAYFNEWVEATPKKAVPYLARADYLMNQGLLARGTDYLKNTAEYDLVKMGVFFELSMADLLIVKEINDQTAYPYAIQLDIAMRQGGKVSKRKIYDQGVMRDPALNWVRNTYLYTLAPNWGGSTNQERQFIEKLRSEYPAYPWLQATEVSWQINDVNALPGEVCDKVADYQKVYDFYRNSWSSYNLGRAYSCNQQFDEARNYLKESIELWPYRAIAWRLLGAIEHKLGDSESALESTRIATHLDPLDDFSFYQLGNIFLYLENYEQSIEAYKNAIKANPEQIDYPQYVELAENFLANPESPHDLYLLTDSWGGMASKIHYVKGRKEGDAIFYDEYNRPNELQLFESDALKKVTRVHQNGNISSELTIKNDKFNGPYQEYSYSGNIISTGTFDNGVQSGEMKLLFENGQSILSNYYEKGKKTGPTKFEIPTSKLNGVTGVSISTEAISHIRSPLNHISQFNYDSGNPIFIYTALDGIQGDNNELYVELFDAKGKRVLDYLSVLENSSDRFNFSFVDYSPDLGADHPGEWTVIISLNSELFDSYTIDVTSQ